MNARDRIAEALHRHLYDDPWDDAGCREEYAPGRSCKVATLEQADAVLAVLPDLLTDPRIIAAVIDALIETEHEDELIVRANAILAVLAKTLTGDQS